MLLLLRAKAALFFCNKNYVKKSKMSIDFPQRQGYNVYKAILEYIRFRVRPMSRERLCFDGQADTFFNVS